MKQVKEGKEGRRERLWGLEGKNEGRKERMGEWGVEGSTGGLRRQKGKSEHL